jgi:hypothetical protein
MFKLRIRVTGNGRQTNWETFPALCTKVLFPPSQFKLGIQLYKKTPI